MYSLSNERGLYIRMTSPHERWQTLSDFLEKTHRKLLSHLHRGVRWNFACPLQPNVSRNMPDVTDTVQAFMNRFNPERTRVVFISPDVNENLLQEGQMAAADQLRRSFPNGVEVCWIDTRRSPRQREELRQMRANGRFLSDFFGVR